MEQPILKRAGFKRAAIGQCKRAGCGAGWIQHLHHQDAIADGQCTRAIRVADCGFCRPTSADLRAVHDQHVGLRCGPPLIEHRVEFQRAAIGDESSGAANAPNGERGREASLASAGDHEHVARDGVALQVDRARVSERLHADQVALQGAVECHRVVRVPEREILPGVIQRNGACHGGQRQDSVVGEAVVLAVAQIRYGHPERIADTVSIGVGEVPQVERTIVGDAVIAAGELHEAGNEAVIDNHRIAGNCEIRQRPDAAVICQDRGAATVRAQEHASGRQA
jgi:hypothetical protein